METNNKYTKQSSTDVQALVIAEMIRCELATPESLGLLSRKKDGSFVVSLQHRKLAKRVLYFLDGDVN